MGWEYSKYAAVCSECGRQGVCIKGSDDWCRTSTSWEGFKDQAADPNAIVRKRADPRDSRALCECGSDKIVIGQLIKD